MNVKPYLLLGGALALAAVLAIAISQQLVDVVGHAAVYGGDACPDRDVVCGTPPTGGVLSLVVGCTIASIAALPIVRGSLVRRP